MIILFGASGDIHKKKVYPSLLNKFMKEGLNRVFGIGRTNFSDEEYKNLILKSISNCFITEEMKMNYVNKFSYIKGDYGDDRLYRELRYILSSILDEGIEIRIYCGVPSEIMIKIIKGFMRAGIQDIFKLIFLIEKPLGNSLKEYNKYYNKIYKYKLIENIRLIDHYLAKDCISNLKDITNEGNIKSIDINIYEKEGVDHRIGYFDNVGLIKDMFQGHIMCIIMKLIGNRYKYLRLGEISKQILKQYYEYLGKNSTETYFRLVLYWRNIMINVECGKKLKEDKKEIIISYNDENDKKVIKINSSPFDYEYMFKDKLNNSLFCVDNDNRVAWKKTDEILEKINNVIIVEKY